MPKKAETEAKPRKRKRRRVWKRLGFGVLFGSPVFVLVMWILVNRVEWLGPMVADALRAVIGKDAVTELQNIGYGVQDRFYQYWRRGESPKAYWEVPDTAPTTPEPQAEAPVPVHSAEPELPDVPHPPRDVGPVHESWSAPGDGQWLPMKLQDFPDLTPPMWKTLLHPDKNRSWAEVFVVAIDMQLTEIQLVAGSKEPVATVEAAMGVERPGRVPEHLEDQVLAAFNGGFKTEHGTYGMRIGDTTFVAPKPGTCAVALFEDRSIEVGPWEKLEVREDQMQWWRQTPNCMVEEGKLHDKLKAGLSKKWGATLDGETVIRRSAIGVDESGRLLLVGISNHTTAHAIANGMRHAGALNVAQLDVNFSYPKFVLFERSEEAKKRVAVALVDGFEFSEDEYIRKKSRRDFFYVTASAGREAAVR